VILGTRAVREPDFLGSAAERHPGRIILGLDARNGMLATDGWDATTQISAVGFAQRAAGLQLAAIVYTDIDRDGMLEGLNLAATVALAEAVATPVIASG
ncbi:MAG: 1-(5-phosphoribosyl)-5-((5-phosphoribosylamino)methylideneamino)imidazole-4-carboxamide isomerase, partial [Xanthomonadales bacterium]|nr:1-(5-phosphoribosyl)-5-((5-phosphoribosylamino)methylideneamino)imidazole-4-carboxamide isomerase [Xanthomonadales bacterium]NIO12691.1 1-(5-phosphoribosyl)-5-((5-phosphoribosylamino)methylideneamino)imidazole-4-carboxamide isomerase [Xanthomonadales bacterium]NIP77352.1 1-(5-phosphoribosyl)-5-((5-phosphoribosylamino)methylideneamino)imidazole-4-carboxamide isomerase [Xanthomonadales bacterium]NIQ35766.1 1-(5-phosphoribosyl)-5-((5-phosphoribosylamino)methylideneamino)imidazole-4-carboxamide i